MLEEKLEKIALELSAIKHVLITLTEAKEPAKVEKPAKVEEPVKVEETPKAEEKKPRRKRVPRKKKAAAPKALSAVDVRHALAEATERAGEDEVKALMEDWEIETIADLGDDQQDLKDFIEQLNELS